MYQDHLYLDKVHTWIVLKILDDTVTKKHRRNNLFQFDHFSWANTPAGNYMFKVNNRNTGAKYIQRQ